MENPIIFHFVFRILTIKEMLFKESQCKGLVNYPKKRKYKIVPITTKSNMAWIVPR